MNITRNNIQFTTNGNNAEFWHHFESGAWEKETIQILDENLKSDDIFIDIGAWIGPITLYCANKLAKCYSLEPDIIAFENLVENVSLNPELTPKISYFNTAISSTSGKLKLYSRHQYGDSGSSTLKRIKSKNDSAYANCITFSNFLSIEKISKLDFIKMDIEGGEFFVIPSMVQEIKKLKPTMLISFHFHALVEYYMMKLLPFGILRRLYRYFGLDFVEIKAQSKMIKVIESLCCQDMSDQNGKSIDILGLHNMNLSEIDMLLFKWN